MVAFIEALLLIWLQVRSPCVSIAAELCSHLLICGDFNYSVC